MNPLQLRARRPLGIAGLLARRVFPSGGARADSRTWTHRPLVWFWGLALCSSACPFDWAGVERSSPGTFPPETALCGIEALDEVIEQWCPADPQHCQARVNCCQAANFPGTTAQCEERIAHSCREAARDNLEAGSCFIPHANLQQCASAWAEAVNGCAPAREWSADYQRHLEAIGCPSVWTTGWVREGEPCSQGVQCLVPSEEYRAVCFRSQQDVDARCHAVVLSEVGERCLTTTNCPDTYICNSTGRCQPPADLGARCELSSDCESSRCVDGACVSTTAASCETDRDCGSFAECQNGECQLRPLANSAFCSFGPPQRGSARCSLSSLVAEQLAPNAQNCSWSTATSEVAMTCVEAATSAGFDAFFVLPQGARGYNSQEAMIVRTDGHRTVLRAEFTPEGALLRINQQQCNGFVQGVPWWSCAPEQEEEVVCEPTEGP